jgi:hypothetical protein
MRERKARIPQFIAVMWLALACAAAPAYVDKRVALAKVYAGMNVTFHALAAAGIAHVAATRLEPSSRDRWFCRSDTWVLGSAVCLGILSHGILDGLLSAALDVFLAGLLAVG